MATKRTKKRAVLTALPKRIEKVQADASKAINRGYKATLQLLPPNSRKVVRDLSSQLDGAATELRARGRKVLRGVERRGEQVAEQVEAAVTGAERRRSRPPGAAGGTPGAAGRNELTRGRRTSPLPAKISLPVRAGDRIRLSTPGGGGWGRKR
jgi:hypothetical protein